MLERREIKEKTL